MDFKENNIEWVTGDSTIAVTLTSQRHITKIPGGRRKASPLGSRP